MATVKLVNIFLFGVAKPRVLFVDNLRLEGSGLPKVAGLRAFDFGPAGSIVYPGFEGCTDKMLYSDERGFGWIAPEHASVWWIPDGLGSDGVMGKQFKVKLPNGGYQVQFVMDGWGLYHMLPFYSWRKVSINGRSAIDEKQTGEEFFAKQYLAHEDEEDLPGQDLWKKFVEPRQKVYAFDVEVKDGVLTLDLDSDQSWGRMLVHMVVFPKDQFLAADKWVRALEAKRHAAFNELVVVNVPKPAGAEPKATEAENKAGYIAFNGHPEEDMAFNARPDGKAAEKITMEAAGGERVNAVLGLYPLKEIRGVNMTVSDLKNAEGKTISADAVTVRKLRNYLKRGGGMMGTIRPYILQDFKGLDLAPGVTRGIWLTVMVPAGRPRAPTAAR